MTRPSSAYAVSLRASDQGPAHLVWRTAENDKTVEFSREPADSMRRQLEARVLSILPIDREL